MLKAQHAIQLRLADRQRLERIITTHKLNPLLISLKFTSNTFDRRAIVEVRCDGVYITSFPITPSS